MPDIGQSSAVWPAFSRVALKAILSSSESVLASTTVRPLALARAITSAVSSTARGVGRLVMMSDAVSATASALWAISTPAALASALRAASMS